MLSIVNRCRPYLLLRSAMLPAAPEGVFYACILFFRMRFRGAAVRDLSYVRASYLALGPRTIEVLGVIVWGVHGRFGSV